MAITRPELRCEELRQFSSRFLLPHRDVQASIGQAKSPQKKIPIFLDSLDAPEFKNIHLPTVD